MEDEQLWFQRAYYVIVIAVILPHMHSMIYVQSIWKLSTVTESHHRTGNEFHIEIVLFMTKVKNSLILPVNQKSDLYLQSRITLLIRYQ